MLINNQIYIFSNGFYLKKNIWMHIAVTLQWFIRALKYTVAFSPVTVENSCGSCTSHYSKIFLQVIQ